MFVGEKTCADKYCKQMLIQKIIPSLKKFENETEIYEWSGLVVKPVKSRADVSNSEIEVSVAPLKGLMATIVFFYKSDFF